MAAKKLRNLLATCQIQRAVVGEDDCKKLKRKLDNYFLPKKNKDHGRFTFSKQRNIEGESVVI